MAKISNVVVYQKTFDGGWAKEIVQRSDGVSLDAYVSHPSSKKKLRSGNDLMKFVQENPQHLKYLNPEEVNFHKHPGGKITPQVRKFNESIRKLKSDTKTSNSDKKSSTKSKTNNPDANGVIVLKHSKPPRMQEDDVKKQEVKPKLEGHLTESSRKEIEKKPDQKYRKPSETEEERRIRKEKERKVRDKSEKKGHRNETNEERSKRKERQRRKHNEKEEPMEQVAKENPGTYYPKPFFQTAAKNEKKKEIKQKKPVVQRPIAPFTSWSTLNETKKLDTSFKIPKSKTECLFSMPDSQLDALFENQVRGLTRPNVFRDHVTNDASELNALEDENWAHLKSIKNNDEKLEYARKAFGNAEPSKPFICRTVYGFLKKKCALKNQPKTDDRVQVGGKRKHSDPIEQRKVPHIDKGFEEIKAAMSGQDSTRESMEEGAIDKESTYSHAVSSYPEPSIIEKNRIEYNLPFGWKKIAVKKTIGENVGKWSARICSPNGTMLKYNKQFDKFLKENPEIEYDVKLTNISLPNIASDDDYDFICCFCGKGFFQSLDNKEFKTHKCNACPYCPEIFIEIDDLNNHIKNIHEKKDNTEQNGGDFKHMEPQMITEDNDRHSHSGEFLKECNDVKKLIGTVLKKQEVKLARIQIDTKKEKENFISFEDYRANVKKLLWKSKLEMIGNTVDNRNEIKDIMMHWDQPMDEFLFLVNIYQDNLHQDKIDQLQFDKVVEIEKIHMKSVKVYGTLPKNKCKDCYFNKYGYDGHQSYDRVIRHFC